jgi:oxygen-independent coproporphyrinogen-3 oxidase
MKKKEEMHMAIAKELQMRKSEFEKEQVETIYFGGGTPSVLTSEEINFF